MVNIKEVVNISSNIAEQTIKHKASSRLLNIKQVADFVNIKQVADFQT